MPARDDMFNQLKTPIIGMLKNMSTHICSNCGHENMSLGIGRCPARRGRKAGRPLLGRDTALHLDIRVAADAAPARIVVFQNPTARRPKASAKVAKALIRRRITA